MNGDHISHSPIKSPCGVVCCTGADTGRGGAGGLKWPRVIPKILQAEFLLQGQQSLRGDSCARGGDGWKWSVSRRKQDTQVTVAYLANSLNNFS